MLRYGYVVVVKIAGVLYSISGLGESEQSVRENIACNLEVLGCPVEIISVARV